MGLNSLIKSGVKQAFQQAGDLVKIIDLKSKTVGDFNFSSGVVSNTGIIQKNVKGIVTLKTRPTSTDMTKRVNILHVIMIEEEVGNINDFDTFGVDGIYYKALKKPVTNGYTVELDLVVC